MRIKSKFYTKQIVFLCAVVFFFACTSKQSQEFKIDLVMYYQGKKINCANLVKLPVQLSEFRFYLHDLNIAEKKLSLIDNQFQHAGIVYVDFSATQRHCQSKLMLSFNQAIIAKNQINDFGNLSFKLGIPSGLNHQNPVKAQAPLNRSDMHWQWLSGYKFLRLEYLKNNQINRLHLGSSGCEGKIPDNVDCKTPNRLLFNLSDFDISKPVIEVHLDELIRPEQETLCMGDFEQEHCKDWISALQNTVFKTASQ